MKVALIVDLIPTLMQVRRMFTRADKDGDGKLTKEEWLSVLNSSGVPTTRWWCFLFISGCCCSCYCCWTIVVFKTSGVPTTKWLSLLMVFVKFCHDAGLHCCCGWCYCSCFCWWPRKSDWVISNQTRCPSQDDCLALPPSMSWLFLLFLLLSSLISSGLVCWTQVGCPPHHKMIVCQDVFFAAIHSGFCCLIAKQGRIEVMLCLVSI